MKNFDLRRGENQLNNKAFDCVVSDMITINFKRSYFVALQNFGPMQKTKASSIHQHKSHTYTHHSVEKPTYLYPTIGISVIADIPDFKSLATVGSVIGIDERKWL